MATDKSVLSLDIVNSMQADDTFFIISSSKATRIKWSTILNSVNEWDNITDKPFDDYDTVTLGLDVDQIDGTRRLKVSPSITNSIHTHTNKAVLDELSDVEGELYYNDTPIGVSAWNEVTDKPFSTVDENDFEIVDDEISISSTLKTTISNLETDSHTHTNKTVLDKFSETSGILQYDGNAIVYTTTAQLVSSNWTGASAPYTQSLTIQGIKSTDTPIIDVVISSNTSTGVQENNQWGYVTRAVTSTNTITFYCYETKPTVNLNIRIKVV